MKQWPYKDISQHTADMWRPRIRYKGIWDMQDLYQFMINWMQERKYIFLEKAYKHKRPSPFGVERQYVWNGVRTVDNNYTYILSIFIHTYDAQDVEVKLKDGSVKTYTKGRIYIEIGGALHYFPDKRWAQKSIWANARMFLSSYILRKRHFWAEWDVLMYREIHKLVWLTRRRLKMEHDDYEQKYWTGVHG